MGWERRRNGLYYYRPVRIGGRPRRIYLGKGDIGRIHELLDRCEQREKLAAAQAHNRQLAEAVELDGQWSVIWQWVRALASAYLLRAGLYRHHGEWRRMMSKPRTRQKKPKAANANEAADLRARLVALNERANTGDPVAVAELGAFLDRHPEVWQTVGDLARLSAASWTAVLSGKDALTGESIRRFVADWKTRLVGPDASQTELAMADAAAVARLALTHAESMATAGNAPLKVAEFAVKRLDAALRRYNTTLKLLAQVQAVGTPQTGSRGSEAKAPRLYVPPGKARRAG